VIRHILNVAHSVIRETLKRHTRSPSWSKIEKEWLSTHSTCAACGVALRPQVHHRFPFHGFPELELDIAGEHTPDKTPNFITLCMGPNECHLRIGHGGAFKFYNPHVTKHARSVRVNPSRRTTVEAHAMKLRLPNVSLSGAGTPGDTTGP
jgi:hypothetical protein